MNNREILFDALTAADVAERLRIIRENQTAINSICLTVARMSGCGHDDRIGMNDAGTGIVIAPPAPPDGGENGAAPGVMTAPPGPPDGGENGEALEMSGKRQK